MTAQPLTFPAALLDAHELLAPQHRDADGLITLAERLLADDRAATSAPVSAAPSGDGFVIVIPDGGRSASLGRDEAQALLLQLAAHLKPAHHARRVWVDKDGDSVEIRHALDDEHAATIRVADCDNRHGSYAYLTLDGALDFALELLARAAAKSGEQTPAT